MKRKNNILIAIITTTAALILLAGCAAKKQTEITQPAQVSQIQAGSIEDLRVNVGDRVFFEVDQANLSIEAQETLIRQATWMQNFPNLSITIEGHADERGTREYNLALSARRAEITRQFLITQGVNTDRLSVIAYGKERPVSLCDSESCWSQNRRAVTVIDQQITLENQQTTSNTQPMITEEQPIQINDQ